MASSQFKYGKYIRCLALPVAFILGCALNAYEPKSANRAENIESDVPFSKDQGHIPGGIPFPYEIETEDGKKLALADFKENVVIIALVTTWCPNCPTVLYDMDSLVEKFQKQGIKNVKIIALNVGNESIEALKIHYKSLDMQLLDAYRSISPEIMQNANICGVPACLVFDKNGKPVWGYLGAANYNSSEFINFIKNLAGK